MSALAVICGFRFEVRPEDEVVERVIVETAERRPVVAEE
jgi:hypothetical protein